MWDDDDAPDAIDDWEGAEEHGHAIGEYLSEQDGYSHPDYPGRNADGTFRRASGRSNRS